MLKIYIIIALFIIIPFALPFIIIAIVRGTGRNSSSGAAAPPMSPVNIPPMYTRPYSQLRAQASPLPQPAPQYAPQVPGKKHDMTVSNVLFLIGTLFVVLSGLAFGVAQWVHTSHSGRVAIIAAAAAVTFILSAVIKKFLNLSGTAVSLYILGTGFMSTALLTAGYYSLMGDWFSFHGGGTFALLAVSIAMAAAMMFLGNGLFRKLPLFYTALSCTALTMLFIAFQAGSTIEGTALVLIILQALVTAVIYGSNSSRSSKYALPCRLVGTIAAIIYGAIPSMYALSTIAYPTAQGYFIFAVIIAQLIFYGFYKKIDGLIYGESAVSLLLALMIALDVYNEYGRRYCCLCFFGAAFLLYIIHRFVPKFRHIFTESFTFGAAVTGSVICLANITEHGYIPEMLIAMLMSAVIGAYVFSRNNGISTASGITAVFLPLLTCGSAARIVISETGLSSISANTICWCFLAFIFTSSAFILKEVTGKDAKGIEAARYTDLIAAGVILIAASGTNSLYILPAAVCLIHFAVSNRMRCNFTALMPALALIIIAYKAVSEYSSDEIIKLIVLSAVFLTYMGLSRLVYPNGILVSSEGKTAVDPLLSTSWLAILMMNVPGRNSAFCMLMAMAIYSACFIKKKTPDHVSSILLSVTTALTAAALITRPFLIPDSAEISSKITIAIVALTGLACRFIWRKYTDAAKYSSNGIFIFSFAALLLDAVHFDNGANTIFVMAVMIFVLIISIMSRSKTWFITSSACLLTITVYATREYLMALNWWIYLFIAGMILIGLAAVNEYCKKNNETLRSSVARRFSGWTW